MPIDSTFASQMALHQKTNGKSSTNIKTLRLGYVSSIGQEMAYANNHLIILKV